MASLIDEDVCEVIDGKLGRDQPGEMSGQAGVIPRDLTTKPECSSELAPSPHSLACDLSTYTQD